MKKIYSYYTAGELIFKTAQLLFGACLGVAFWHYRIYVALLFLAIIVLFVIYEDFRLIMVTDSSVSEIRRVNNVCSIDIKEIIEVSTSVKDNKEFISVYGEGKVITFPYKKRTFHSIMIAMGMEEETVNRFLLPEACDSSEECGRFLVKKSVVLIDELISKKRLLKRELVLLDERDLS